MDCGCRAGRNAWQLANRASRLISSAPTTPRITSRAARTATTGATTRIRCFASETTRNGTSENGENGPSSDAPQPSRSRWPKIKRVFSGIQPTGVPHLGNYLGALREWKRLQDTAHPDTELFFCIVDLHALTVPRPAAELRENRSQMLAALLAIGLDLKRSCIYFQSSLKQHAELQWILSCTASMGYLSRMTQWKSKMHLSEDASLDDPAARKGLKHGLFSYPILQAADILLHRATHVPVGDDQRQHLEFARECVTNFNHTYKTNIFEAPQTLVSPSKRIMSLSNPAQKMSKSDPSAKSRILITDSPEAITKKIRHAVTDSLDSVTYEPETRPGVANLLEILSGFDPQGRTPAQLGEEMKGYKIADLKQVTTGVLCHELAPVRERYEELMADKAEMYKDVAESNYRAKYSAGKTMDSVKRVVGLQ